MKLYVSPGVQCMRDLVMVVWQVWIGERIRMRSKLRGAFGWHGPAR